MLPAVVLASVGDSLLWLREEPRDAARDLSTRASLVGGVTRVWRVTLEREPRPSEWRIATAGVTPVGVFADQTRPWWCVWCDDMVAVAPVPGADELQALEMPSLVFRVGPIAGATESAYVLCETDVLLFDLVEGKARERWRLALGAVVVRSSVRDGALRVELDDGSSAEIPLRGQIPRTVSSNQTHGKKTRSSHE